MGSLGMQMKLNQEDLTMRFNAYIDVYPYTQILSQLPLSYCILLGILEVITVLFQLGRPIITMN